MFCSFCNNEIKAGTGTLFVYKDGTTLVFCSSKCRKNLIGLGREGRLQRWTSKVVALTGEKKKEEKKDSAFAKDIEAKLAEKAAKKPEGKK